jgi:HSP20 family protein
MENESNKEKDVLRELGEGLSQFGQRLGKKVNELVENFSAEEGTGLGDFRPISDVYETASHYVIEVELSGLTKEQVKIAAQEDILTVKGEKVRGNEADITGFHKRGRRFGHFVLTFELPSTGIEMEGIKAKFNEGLLVIQFPMDKPEPPASEDDEDMTKIDIE